MLQIVDYAKWVGLAAVIGGLYTHGYTTGKASVQSEWDKARAEAAIEDLQRLAESQAEIMKLETMKNENLKTIDSLKRDLAGVRVQVPVRRCASQGSNSTPPSGGANDTAAPGGFHDNAQAQFDEFIGQLAGEAIKMDEIVESCRVLRDWAANL